MNKSFLIASMIAVAVAACGKKEEAPMPAPAPAAAPAAPAAAAADAAKDAAGKAVDAAKDAAGSAAGAAKDAAAGAAGAAAGVAGAAASTAAGSFPRVMESWLDAAKPWQHGRKRISVSWGGRRITSPPASAACCENKVSSVFTK